jgi:ribosome maturation factor RimP
MRNPEINNELESLISTYLGAQNLDLVEFTYRQEGRNLVLRILVDKPEGGISIGECAALNQQIGSILDEKNLIEGSCLLEVSSPGLDRPLKTSKDFLRCLNREARFFLTEQMNGKIEFKGLIREVKDNSINVETDGQNIEVPFSKIFRVKQVIQ